VKDWKMKKAITREQWLERAVDVIRASVKKTVVVPPVKVSCSWAGGGDSNKRIGECWPKAASQADINEIFISPKIEDPVRVVGILAHELAHAVIDCKHGHKAPFVAAATKLKCEGKPTQMVPPIEVSQAWADKVIAKWGPFPHRTLDKTKSPVKKQAARMIKCQCNECGAVWRMSGTVIASAMGELSCPVCHTNEEGAVAVGG
jgi:hypothetical protein